MSKWDVDKGPGPYQATRVVGPFALAVRQVLSPGRKPWGDVWKWEIVTASGVISSGENDNGAPAMKDAERALSQLCLDTLKELQT